MLRILDNKQTDEFLAKQEAEDAPITLDDTTESSLAAHLRKSWERNRSHKTQIDEELLRCLRQVKGQYEPDKAAAIAQQGGSTIYMMLTAAKKRGFVAWMLDVLRGTETDGRPFGLQATPIPELPGWMEQQIAMRVAQTTSFPGGPQIIDEQGQPVNTDSPEERIAKMRDETLKIMREMAEEAAQRMEDKIADQMAEGNWDKALEQFIDDMGTYPAAFIEGPIPLAKHTLKWEMTGGRAIPKVSLNVVPHWRRISPFDAYPAPGAESPQDGDFFIREQFSRRDLYSMIGLGEQYKDEALREALEDYGRNGLRDWLWTDSERTSLEHMDSQSASVRDGGQIDGLKCYASAPGYMLLEWGVDIKQIPDPLAEYEIVAILVGRHVVYCDINRDPLAERPVWSASFEPSAGSIWGNSLPFKMRDIQDMCNATARALQNNMAIASGPLAEVNYQRLQEGEDPHNIWPWRMIPVKGSTLANDPAIRWFQPSMNAEALLRVFAEFEQRADDATNIPRYFYGGDQAKGAGATASGLSMLMNSSARGVKVSVFSIDTGVIRPSVRLNYRYNMLFDPDPSIKGDVAVIARGATAMLVKEQAQLRRQEFLNYTNNPTDLAIIGPDGRANILREVARGLEMPVHKIVPDEDEFMARLQQQQQNQPPDPNMARIEADMQRDQAKIEADKAESSEKRALERDIANLRAATEKEIAQMRLSAEREDKRAEREAQARQRQLDRREEAARFALQNRRDNQPQADEAQSREKAASDAAVSRIAEMVQAIQSRIEEMKREPAAQPATQQPAPAAQPMELHVHIDGKTGEAKTKRIKFDHNGDRLAGATMTEQGE